MKSDTKQFAVIVVMVATAVIINAMLIKHLVTKNQPKDAQYYEQLEDEMGKAFLIECKKANGAWFVGFQRDQLIQGCMVPAEQAQIYTEKQL